ncbi:hypothetical protein FRUB_10457 [Fimbriiglobus ruber]|uniref:Uncharacterized protein n=1 Tax=Fimbriiglobus ruber TaxID=1908690 RepID=A0A225DB10_9BACT|nr:hypothetical protein FRUB_10457 [Fimbriiglobus ruber]
MKFLRPRRATAGRSSSNVRPNLCPFSRLPQVGFSANDISHACEGRWHIEVTAVKQGEHRAIATALAFSSA